MNGPAGAWVGLAAAIAACGGTPGDGLHNTASAFALAPGTVLVFTPAGEPDGVEQMLGPSDDGAAWELRAGSADGGPDPGRDWDDATPIEAFAVDASDGIRLDDTLVLPAAFEVGTEVDGARVTAIGPHEAWYGTFDRAVTVEVADGRWAGTQVFAEGLGPVGFTLDAAVWDLVSYDRAVVAGAR